MRINKASIHLPQTLGIICILLYLILQVMQFSSIPEASPLFDVQEKRDLAMAEELARKERFFLKSQTEGKNDNGGNSKGKNTRILQHVDKGFLWARPKPHAKVLSYYDDISVNEIIIIIMNYDIYYYLFCEYQGIFDIDICWYG